MTTLSWDDVATFTQVRPVSSRPEERRREITLPQGGGELLRTGSDVSRVAEELAALPRGVVVAWDTETCNEDGEGLLRRKDGKRWAGGGLSLAYSGREGGVYIPVGSNGVDVLPVLEALMSTRAVLTAWHSTYDVEVVRRILPSFRWRDGDRDAMVLGFLVNEGKSKALKVRGEIEFPGQGVSDDQKALKAMAKEEYDGEWWRMGAEKPETIAPYACTDAVVTRGLDQLFMGVEHVSEAVRNEMRLLPVTDEMMSYGLCIDWDYVRKSLKVAEWEMDRLAKGLPEDLNVNSPKQLREVFFTGDDAERPILFTKTGAPSCSADAMAMMRHPLAQRLASIKKYESVRRFCDGLLRFEGAVDGRVHPGMNWWNQVSARCSVTQPAMGTAPNAGKLPIDVSKAIIAPAGLKYVRYDVAKEEIAVAINFSKDEDLYRAFTEADDFYCALAVEMLGLGDESEVTKEQRGTTKVAALSSAYGVGIEKLALIMAKRLGGLPDDYLDAAAESLGQHKYLYKAFWDFFYRSLNGAKNSEGWIQNPYWPGRWRRIAVNEFGNGKFYTACNWLIQGSSAEVLKAVLIEGWDAFKDFGAEVVLPLHDELQIYLEPGREEAFRILLQEVTDDVSPFHRPKLIWEIK